LLRAYRVSERAAKVGFDWQNAAQVWEKVEEEKGELAEAMAAGDRAAVEDELGDMIFALVNLGRHLEINAEDAVRRAASRFVDRFTVVERRVNERGEKLAGKSIDELEELWQAAKRELK
jgi:ATP diphosphatase